MYKSSQRNFSPELKLEAAQLVLAQHDIVVAAAIRTN